VRLSAFHDQHEGKGGPAKDDGKEQEEEGWLLPFAPRATVIDLKMEEVTATTL